MIEKLVQGGVNVQLKHDPTETSWESHGCVALSLDGAEICRSEDVQHNRSYSERGEKMDALVQQALSAIAAACASLSIATGFVPQQHRNVQSASR